MSSTSHQEQILKTRPSADSYHHGNLRHALLEHAVELARAGGPDAVVLRDVQRMAGVSNSAAYRHFSDRRALLDEVTQYAETQLADAMVAAQDEVSRRGPRTRRARDRLRATGRAYVDFALAEPGLFRTAFAAVDLESAAASTFDVEQEHHPFRILNRCVDDLVDTGVLTQARRTGFDEAAWAAVHGLATLFLDGPMSSLDPSQKSSITERLLDVFESGIA